MWNKNFTNLRNVLAGLYPNDRDARRLAEEAGLNPAYLSCADKPINYWHNIIKEAHHRDRVQAIIEAALEEYPENPWLKSAQQGNLSPIIGPDIEEDLDWQGTTDSEQLEKIIGKQSTLLPINFLEQGLARATSVAKVVRSDGSSGTGFLVPGDLLLTNHHVLPSEEVARETILHFNYQKTTDGLDAPVERVGLLPDQVFLTSEQDDWTVVRTHGNPSERWGMLNLATATPKVGERVSIIQHPGGGDKQIALHHNLIVFVGDNRVQYLTDTLPGSSGSPVFDSEWRLIALHHSGGWLREPGSKQTYFRNEGILVNIIREQLISAGLYPA
jgi:V8-like Glu-specific endopeptidase